MNIGDTISGCIVLGIAPAGDGESYILLLRQPGTRVQYVTGRVGVRQLPRPEEWWSGTYSSELEDAVKHWVKRSCIADDDLASAVKWLTRLIENTEKALAPEHTCNGVNPTPVSECPACDAERCGETLNGVRCTQSENDTHAHDWDKEN